MAYPTSLATQEHQRKILEDIQTKKQLLQKGGASTTSSLIIPPPVAALNPATRSVWNQANTQSYGFFIPQDSTFGNTILPVLPRFDSPAAQK